MTSEELIPPRVHLDEDTRTPVVSDSKVAPNVGPTAQEKKLSKRMATGKKKSDKDRGPPSGSYQGLEDPFSSRS